MAVERIDKYLERYNVAMEIQKFQNTTSISLEDIKKEFPDFLIPQMYYYLDDLPLLDYLQRNLTPIEPEISHEFNDIDSKDICVH